MWILKLGHEAERTKQLHLNCHKLFSSNLHFKAKCSSKVKVKVAQTDWVPEATPTTMALGLV
jgi:hypothetical protein